MPCNECQSPIQIPPAEELERGGCPTCGHPLVEPDGDASEVMCMNCGEGPLDYEEHAGDAVECEQCGETHRVSNSPEMEA